MATIGCALAGFLSFVARDAGEEPAPDAPRQAGSTKHEPPVPVADLIRGLYNHNPVPVLFDHEDAQRPLFARDYDWREYDRVYSSIRQLLARAEEALPELLQHLDDKHYSFTDAPCDCAYNNSVGDICRRIIEETLTEAYYRYSPESPGDEQWFHALNVPLDLYGTHGELKAWCDKRKGKRLFELQIELCELAIKTIPTLDEIPDEDKAKATAAIKRQIKTLKGLKKPVLVERWGSRGPSTGCYTRESAEWDRQSYDRLTQMDEELKKRKSGCGGKGMNKVGK